MCEDECYELTIEGDKKISIVTGFEDENHKDNNDKGTSSTQVHIFLYNQRPYYVVRQ